MDDPEFNASLMKLFAEAPAFPDAAEFARSVERRLARTWALRRGLIFAAGVGGGAIALAQAMGSGVLAHLEGPPRVIAALREMIVQIPFASHLAGLDLPLGGEVLWVAVALVILAVVLIIGRGIEGT